jgi:hypothetical protein
MDYTVSYRFGRDDYLALLRAYRLRGPFGRLGRFGRYACFALVVVVLTNLLVLEPWNDPVVALITSALLMVVMFAVAPLGEFLGERVLLQMRFSKLSVANKDCTLVFSDDGIRTKYGDIEGRMPWRSITHMVTNKAYIYLPISRAEAVLVPTRALPSPGAVANLEHYIRSRLGAAAAG